MFCLLENFSLHLLLISPPDYYSFIKLFLTKNRLDQMTSWPQGHFKELRSSSLLLPSPHQQPAQVSKPISVAPGKLEFQMSAWVEFHTQSGGWSDSQLWVGASLSLRKGSRLRSLSSTGCGQFYLLQKWIMCSSLCPLSIEEIMTHP